MKKITLLVASLFVCGATFAQMTLSQSVDPVTIDTGGVACWASGTGEYRDNAFARTYNLAGDFGISEAFEITNVEFGQATGADGKVVTVNIYTIDDEDLGAADFELIGTADTTIEAANDDSLVNVPIVAVVPAGALIAVEVFAPDEGTTTGLTFFPGFNTAGQNATAWLRSNGTGTGGANTGCSIEYTDSNTIVADPQEYVINITGDVTTLGANDVTLEGVSIYPNPASDVVNVKVPANVEITGAVLYDILGKQVSATISNGQINVANLTSGAYMLKVDTSVGTLTEKVIIQ